MQASNPLQNTLTEQDYLEGEKISKVRHEYVAGQVFAMADSSVRHNRIAMNITNFIYNVADAMEGNCEVFASDIKVRIKHRQSFYYPDVLLSCDEIDDEDPYYKDHPCLLVEVLSNSTKDKDRIEKLLAYQTIRRLQGYMIVAQDHASVIMVRKNEQGEWFSQTYNDNEAQILLPCIDAELPLAQIYKRVVFDGEQVTTLEN